MLLSPVQGAPPNVLPDECVPPPADEPGALDAPAVQGQEDPAQHQVVLAQEQVLHRGLHGCGGNGTSTLHIHSFIHLLLCSE